jgi:hypothetical protein
MDDLKDFIEKIDQRAGGMPSFDDFDFGKELGLSAKQIEGLKAMFPKMATEFLQGGLQFAEEEKRMKEADQYLQKQVGDLLAQNISSLRNMFLTLTGLSLTVIGAVISVRAANPAFFKGSITLYSGIGLLGICIVASILYLLDRLSAENRNLTKRINFQQSSMAKMRELMRASFEGKKSFDEYFATRKDLVQKIADEEIELLAKTRGQSKLIEYTPAIICYSFLGGLVLVALALFI